MEMTMQLAGVCGTLGLLWLTLTGMKKLRAGETGRGRLQVRQRVSLTSGCQLAVVEWDGREMLVATGSQACSVVASKPLERVVCGE